MTEERIEIDALADVIAARGASRRSITAIAGPPGAGKSTLSEALAEALNDRDPQSASIFTKDGYHYDDAILNARGWRPRKGAPHTFDVAGFAHTLRRLRKNDEPEVAVPVFDRAIETSRAGARIIPSTVRHLIVEGNYLLLDQAPWRDLMALFDTTVRIDVPLAEIERRLLDRWRDLPPEEQRAKIEENDLPNARLVLEESQPAEFILVQAT